MPANNVNNGHETIEISFALLLGWLNQKSPNAAMANKRDMLVAASGFAEMEYTEEGIRKALKRGTARPWKIQRSNFGDFCRQFGVEDKDYREVEAIWTGNEPLVSLPDLEQEFPLPHSKLILRTFHPTLTKPEADPNFQDGKLHFAQHENRLSPVDHTPHSKRSVFVEGIEIWYDQQLAAGAVTQHKAKFAEARNYLRISNAGKTSDDQSAKNGVGLVIIRETAQVMLTFEVRPIPRSALVEASRGFADPSDKKLESATVLREVFEELGVQPMELPKAHGRAYWPLGEYYTDTGALSDQVKFALLVSDTLNRELAKSKLAGNRFQLATVLIDGAAFFRACAAPLTTVLTPDPNDVISLHPELLDFAHGFYLQDMFTLLIGNLAKARLPALVIASQSTALEQLLRKLGISQAT